MPKIKAAIWGATGYTGCEILRMLLRHPDADPVFLTAKIDADTPIADIFPDLKSKTDLICHAGGTHPEIDVAFLALPHTVSMKFVPGLLSQGIKVVDLSADYRLRDRDEYARWYETPHEDADGLAEAVYGLPEMFRDQIREASLIANPGCYPTSAILAIAPLKDSDMKLQSVIIDAKTGISGAGINAAPALRAECSESVKAYKVGVHQHQPEIRQYVSDILGYDPDPLFVPHLIPMERGILSTCYLTLDSEPSEEELFNLYSNCYKDEKFVRVKKNLPATKDVTGTNFCDIAVRTRGNTAIVISCIDNLLKGAAGQAVQNMNIMFNLPEDQGM